MTNQQILEKAIQKAIDAGWQPPLYMQSPDWRVKASYGHYDILFSRSFAKALWGEETLSPNYGDMEMLSEPDYAWQHHLQQMVIAEDPIKYLGENI